MKEAAGEANITVITIVLIGVVAAVGVILIPRLMETAKAKACCVNGGGYVSGKQCCWDYNGNPCGSHNTLKKSGIGKSDRFKACME